MESITFYLKACRYLFDRRNSLIPKYEKYLCQLTHSDTNENKFTFNIMFFKWCSIKSMVHILTRLNDFFINRQYLIQSHLLLVVNCECNFALYTIYPHIVCTACGQLCSQMPSKRNSESQTRAPFTSESSVPPTDIETANEICE